ncbi:hypothetical protein LJC57_08695 [Parabacteroides sp. OttesenSCG-928-G07]|nr:hypothetical protein [Parabacteroides sp. OttesenSCG-928-G07]
MRRYLYIAFIIPRASARGCIQVAATRQQNTLTWWREVVSSPRVCLAISAVTSMKGCR